MNVRESPTEVQTNGHFRRQFFLFFHSGQRFHPDVVICVFEKRLTIE